jgi:hypothetical protein
MKSPVLPKAEPGAISMMDVSSPPRLKEEQMSPRMPETPEALKAGSPTSLHGLDMRITNLYEKLDGCIFKEQTDRQDTVSHMEAQQQKQRLDDIKVATANSLTMLDDRGDKLLVIMRNEMEVRFKAQTAQTLLMQKNAATRVSTLEEAVRYLGRCVDYQQRAVVHRLRDEIHRRSEHLNTMKEQEAKVMDQTRAITDLLNPLLRQSETPTPTFFSGPTVYVPPPPPRAMSTGNLGTPVPMDTVIGPR